MLQVLPSLHTVWLISFKLFFQFPLLFLPFPLVAFFSCVGFHFVFFGYLLRCLHTVWLISFKLFFQFSLLFLPFPLVTFFSCVGFHSVFFEYLLLFLHTVWLISFKLFFQFPLLFLPFPLVTFFSCVGVHSVFLSYFLSWPVHALLQVLPSLRTVWLISFKLFFQFPLLFLPFPFVTFFLSVGFHSVFWAYLLLFLQTVWLISFKLFFQFPLLFLPFPLVSFFPCVGFHSLFFGYFLLLSRFSLCFADHFFNHPSYDFLSLPLIVLVSPATLERQPIHQSHRGRCSQSVWSPMCSYELSFAPPRCLAGIMRYHSFLRFHYIFYQVASLLAWSRVITSTS